MFKICRYLGLLLSNHKVCVLIPDPKILNTKLPIFIEKVLHIDALYEYVEECVNVNKVLWVVITTTFYKCKTDNPLSLISLKPTLFAFKQLVTPCVGSDYAGQWSGVGVELLNDCSCVSGNMNEIFDIWAVTWSNTGYYRCNVQYLRSLNTRILLCYQFHVL